MAGTAKTDLDAVTILAGDIAGTNRPLGFDLGQELDSIKHGVIELHRRVTKLKAYCTEGATTAALATVETDLT